MLLQVLAQMALSFDPEQRPTFSFINNELVTLLPQLQAKVSRPCLAEPPEVNVHKWAGWLRRCNRTKKDEKKQKAAMNEECGMHE